MRRVAAEVGRRRARDRGDWCGQDFRSGRGHQRVCEDARSKRVRAGHLPFLLRVEDCSEASGDGDSRDGAGRRARIGDGGALSRGGADAQVGQPEVKLGIIPGAGGTQRLPRLAGVAKAVEMCALGEPVRAADALKLGIVDELIEGDSDAPATGAVAFARTCGARSPCAKTRDRGEKLAAEADNAAIFATAREHAGKKQRGMMAPLAAIDAVEAATKLPFDGRMRARTRAICRVPCFRSNRAR